MKCTIPEISWHNRDPVLSVDVQPSTNEGFYRLASGGTDSHVLIWHLKILDTGATTTEPVSDLTRHQKAVNVVRWSHSGQYLASGDDDANIIIWHQKSDDLAVMLDGDNDDKEKWSVFKVLRGHKEDVYDICWSPDSSKLISGSVDNTAIIWDLNKGLNDNILTDHKGFVQGVTWDPLGQYVATLSSDRICRVFTETGKQVKARLKQGQLPVPESHMLHGQVVRYFHDDTLKSFFRRLTFSSDGSFIIAPAGCLEFGPNNEKLYTSYLYTTSSLTQPAAILPSPGQYTVAARCCPILFQLRPDGPDPLVALPYRIIFAIATRSSVVLYDTQQPSPFATISNIHYTRLTDVTWSQDGRLLAVSSTDGFCSLVTFEPGELGAEYVKEPEVVEQNANEILNDTVEEVMDTSINVSVDEKKEEKKEMKTSFLQKWTKKVQDKGEAGKTKDKRPVSILEVRRKSKGLEKSHTTQKEKPITIEVRRKPKETNKEDKASKEEKPINKIEVRRKPKDTVQNEEDTFSVKEEKTKNEEQVENHKIQDQKIIQEVKSSTMEVDDDVILIEPENENKNKENVLTDQKEVASNSKSENTTISNDEKKGVKKSFQNSTPAKPITVRRKPRESPGGQMNITQFLKSGSKIPVTPSKTKVQQESKINPFISDETTEKTSSTTDFDIIQIDDDSCHEVLPIVQEVLVFEDDSQSLKLVLEETVDEPPIKIKKVEKMDVDKDSNLGNKINESDTTKTSSDSENKLENLTDKRKFSNKSSPEQVTELLNGDSKQKSENISKEETVINSDIKTGNCDKKDSISDSSEKVLEKPIPLSHVLSLPKNSPAKKRVPLITLSSPKHKKTPF